VSRLAIRSPLRVVPLVRLLLDSPLLAHGTELGHIEAVPPRREEEADEHYTASKEHERGKPDRGHGNLSNATTFEA